MEAGLLPPACWLADNEAELKSVRVHEIGQHCQWHLQEQMVRYDRPALPLSYLITRGSGRWTLHYKAPQIVGRMNLKQIGDPDFEDRVMRPNSVHEDFMKSYHLSLPQLFEYPSGEELWCIAALKRHFKGLIRVKGCQCCHLNLTEPP